MSCNSLHDWFKTLSRLIAMVSSLIERVDGLRLSDGSDVKL